MKARSVLAPFVLLLILLRGCSVKHGPKNPAKNTHPVQRYEVTATSEAPGAWDSIGGYIGYEVINRECIPMIPFVGEQDIPNIGLDIEMARVGDHMWRGYFYRDALRDADYFELGVCHWDVTSVGVSAIAQGVRFNWGGLLRSLFHASPRTRYFKTSVYGDRSFARSGAQDFDPDDPDVVQQPDAYFPVTIAVREAEP